MCCCLLCHLRICSEYEQFRTRALKEPEDSRDMMELISFMEQARTELVRDQWEAVQVRTRQLGTGGWGGGIPLASLQ